MTEKPISDYGSVLRFMRELERYRAQRKPVEYARTRKKGRK